MDLQVTYQTYDWGKKGNESIVAKLAALNITDFEIDDTKTYAELWMGTHPNGQATIRQTGELLKTYLQKNPSSLGKSQKHFGSELPFLLKVLAVNKPLSIQVHPSKAKAAELHQKYPNAYKDPNYKPEMAIALTMFETMCGFRLYSEIKKSLQDVPELAQIIGSEFTNEFMQDPNPNTLKKCFGALLNAPKVQIETGIQALLKRLPSMPKSAQLEQYQNLVTVLQNNFPGDVGVFAPYFLNNVILNKGEAIFIPENTPHCYISGDCIECMACSDNVIRAGLTSKPKDIVTLLDILNYEPVKVTKYVLRGEPKDQSLTIYSPPVMDFCVSHLIVSAMEDYSLGYLYYCAIILVMTGEGVIAELPFQKGSVLFIPAGELYIISAKTDVSLYMAQPNISE